MTIVAPVFYEWTWYDGHEFLPCADVTVDDLDRKLLWLHETRHEGWQTAVETTSRLRNHMISTGAKRWSELRGFRLVGNLEVDSSQEGWWDKEGEASWFVVFEMPSD